MWSPVVKANIALAMIKTAHLEGDIWAEIYFERELLQNSKVARCTIQMIKSLHYLFIDKQNNVGKVGRIKMSAFSILFFIKTPN